MSIFSLDYNHREASSIATFTKGDFDEATAELAVKYSPMRAAALCRCFAYMRSAIPLFMFQNYRMDIDSCNLLADELASSAFKALSDPYKLSLSELGEITGSNGSNKTLTYISTYSLQALGTILEELLSFLGEAVEDTTLSPWLIIEMGVEMASSAGSQLAESIQSPHKIFVNSDVISRVYEHLKK